MKGAAILCCFNKLGKMFLQAIIWMPSLGLISVLCTEVCNIRDFLFVDCYIHLQM